MNIFTYLKRHSVLATTLAIVAVIMMIIAGRMAARKGAAIETNLGARQVALVAASAFRKDASTVSANGTVESIAQADLKSQTSAPVSSINAQVGDSVYAGQVILELKNADIRARLDQAKASLALAQGQYETGTVSLDSARTGARDKARDAYSAVDQAARGQLDQFLFNAASGVQPLSARVSDAKLIDQLHADRDDLENYLAPWKAKVDSLTDTSDNDELLGVLAQSKVVLASAQKLFDDASTALNSLSKDMSSSDAATISGWKAVVSSAKASVSGASAAVTSADTALRNAQSGRGTTAEASIASAEAGVKSLEAELAKTIVVSPINGKVAAVPLRVGELASPGTLLASVVGSQGLQVKAFASGEDIARITKGAPATIAGAVQGVVSAVAPSVNQTNKKVEVTIAVSNPDRTNLVVGQSVSVAIKGASQTGANAAGSYFLPIQNVKIVPGDAYIFTINADSKLVKHSVTLGAVQGDFIEVTSGIADDMRIVSPVYELEEGQKVDAE
ncbi:MAG TPA: HlyD family efflux transporter periplasmic adaptor subunit [Candidatus Paceibacterota bacterium]|nr:HlyD family efflux transporter periplasmic adaptor subunit [Candidatus Paceibacterota bacterium]